MTLRADDLASLFGNAPQPLTMRQGTVVTWNSETGENSVIVDGGLLENLPILNTSESIALKTGMVVVLVRWSSQYYILGRVTRPNDPGFAGAAVDFKGDWGSYNEFELRADTLLYIGKTLPVPLWADQALVFVTANMSVVNTTGAADYAQLEAVIDGGPGRPAYPLIGAGILGTMAVSAQRVISVVGGGTIGVGTWWRTYGANWPSHGSNIVNFDSFAIFRSVT